MSEVLKLQMVDKINAQLQALGLKRADVSLLTARGGIGKEGAFFSVKIETLDGRRFTCEAQGSLLDFLGPEDLAQC
jgi:hypothetical protein